MYHSLALVTQLSKNITLDEVSPDRVHSNFDESGKRTLNFIPPDVAERDSNFALNCCFRCRTRYQVIIESFTPSDIGF